MEYLQVFLLFFFCIGRCQQFGKADDGILARKADLERSAFSAFSFASANASSVCLIEVMSCTVSTMRSSLSRVINTPEIITSHFTNSCSSMAIFSDDCKSVNSFFWRKAFPIAPLTGHSWQKAWVPHPPLADKAFRHCNRSPTRFSLPTGL